MADYIESIKKPFSEWRKLVIGAFLYMIPYLNIISGVFANGYLLVSARHFIYKEKYLPEWTDWVDLFFKGIVAIVIWAVYLLPMVILILWFDLADPFNNLLAGRNILFLITASGNRFLAVLIIGIFFSYLAPYAILLYIDRNRFSEAFNLAEILRMPFTFTYFKAWIVAILYSVILGLVVGLASKLLAVTVVIPVILNGFYRITIGLTIMSLLGNAFRELKYQ